MNDTPLTLEQRMTLSYAIAVNEDRIEWYPQHLFGTARTRLRKSLAKRGMIAPSGDGWCVTDAAYTALRIERNPKLGPIPGLNVTFRMLTAEDDCTDGA